MPGHVLVVTDNCERGSYIAECIEGSAECMATVTRCWEQAEELMADDRYTSVVLDLTWTKPIDQAALLAAATGCAHPLPIVAVGAVSNAAQAIKNGADEFLLTAAVDARRIHDAINTAIWRFCRKRRHGMLCVRLDEIFGRLKRYTGPPHTPEMGDGAVR